MRRRLLPFLLVLLGPSLALAESVTIAAAVREAVTAHPSVLTGDAQVAGAAGGVTEARSRYLPHLRFSETFSVTNEPGGSLFIALNQGRNVMNDRRYDPVDPPTQHDFASRLTIEQTLFDAEALYGSKAAQKRLVMASADNRWRSEAAGFAAFQAYLEVQRNQAAQQATISSRQEAAELLRLARERYGAGIGLKADELRAQVQLLEAERRDLAVRNDLSMAQRRLALAMGREKGEAGIAAPLSEALFTPDAGGEEGAERDDLRALALTVDALELERQARRAAALPRVELFASYALHGEASPLSTDGEAWGAGAALSWELFDGLRRRGAAARASAEKRVAAAQLDEARREQRFRIEELRLRSEEARAQRQSAAAALAAAEESRRLLQERYASGLADLADLLATQSALDRARFELVLAESRVLFTLGQARFESGRLVSTFLPETEVPQ